MSGVDRVVAQANAKPSDRTPVIPRRLVKLNCDYKRDQHRGNTGCFFTTRVLRGTPALSVFTPGRLYPRLTPLGELVKRLFFHLAEIHPDVVRIDRYAIMPDHIHFCFYLLAYSKRTPVQLVTSTLHLIEKEAREQFGIDRLWELEGELTICYSRKTYDDKNRYTRENYSRWHLDHEARAQAHPHTVSHARLDPAYEWEGYGNLLLLNGGPFLPAYVSRAVTQEEFTRFAKTAVVLVKQGWTLVGGFVSERERALLDAVLKGASESRVIQVAAMKLRDRKLPATFAKLFYEGRFLRVTSTGEEACTRAICVWHNLWAESLCRTWRESALRFLRSRLADPARRAAAEAFIATWPAPDPRKYSGPRPLP